MIEKIKDNIDLLSHISKCLWETNKKDNQWYWFKSFINQDEKTSSLIVYKDLKRWWYDFSSWLWGSIIDFEKNYYWIETWQAIKQLKQQYNIQDDWNVKQEFKKQPKRYELITEFNKYRFKEINNILKCFLRKRNINYDTIEEKKEKIAEIAKEIGYYEWLYINKENYKDIIIFPCYDWHNNIIGWKIRRADGEKIQNWEKEIKSLSLIKTKNYDGDIPFTTWLIYKKEHLIENYVLICEWETDYIILKLLWFKSVIGNLWWVASNRKYIKELVKKVKNIVCLYDNDDAGKKWAIRLEEELWRPIKVIDYPVIEWLDKYDINDLYKIWYNQEDILELIKNSKFIEKEKEEIIEEVKEKESKLYKDRFFYHNWMLRYFDIQELKFHRPCELASHFFLKTKELEDMRQASIIPTYKWICYKDWGKEWYYNLLNKKEVLNIWNNIDYDEKIKFLIENICWNKKKNIEWLERSILYKYTFLNDVLIPAVVFFWVWWSGKWLFLKLLSTIFWKKNVMIWLTQQNIDSNFSAYQWRKLVVEFKELFTRNTMVWKKNMNKLKTIIMEDEIMIEKKWQDPITIDNIAWFIMSSNENKPILLDSNDSWNRRFCIIETWKKIPLEEWKEIEKIVNNKEKVSNFLSYLQNKYKNNLKEWDIQPLDNEEKKILEYNCESQSNLFFKWFEAKYPHINKISNEQLRQLIDMYCIQNWENEFDEWFKKNNFNNWLSTRYKNNVFTFNWVSYRWYMINKKVDWQWFDIDLLKPKKKII